MISNTTALWLTGSTIALFLIGMAIAAAFSWRSRLKQSEEDEYFPAHSFPEIERDPDRIRDFVEGGEWPA